MQNVILTAEPRFPGARKLPRRNSTFCRVYDVDSGLHGSGLWISALQTFQVFVDSHIV